MSEGFDLEKMLQSKRAMRRDLAARPIAEKLAMLDAMRERTLSLRAATRPAQVLTARDRQLDAGR